MNPGRWQIGTQALIFWLAIAGLLAFSCLLVVAGDSSVLWSAPVALLVYAAGCWLLISKNRMRLTDLTPLSWSLLVFFVQLVLIPSLILISEPFTGSLRVLPSAASINQGLLLSTFAFTAFVTGFTFCNRTLATSRATQSVPFVWKPPVSAAIGFVLIGVTGFYLYSSQSRSLEMLLDPKLARQVARSSETGFAEAAATILRPFMAAGVILFWIRLIQSPLCGSLAARLAASAGAAGLVMVAMSTYSFNRAAFVVPMIAMAAVLVRGYRMPVWWFWGAAMAAVIPLWVIGSFRTSGTGAYDFVLALQDFSSREPIRQLSEGAQLYGGGPQFLGYLLEQNGDAPLYWGSTLVASVLSPIPVVGRTWRDMSGTALYNQMIYGSSVSLDQVVPFSGELLMNFHLPGVFAGFAALGACLAWVHQKFRTSASPVDAYFCQYGGIWLSFLITGSLFVIAQIAVFMCLPMYFWLLIRRLARRRHQKRFATVRVVWTVPGLPQFSPKRAES